MATVITKVEINGDYARIFGTVNGVAVQASGWVSATSGMTKAQKIAYATGLLNAAADPGYTDVTPQFQ